CRCRLAVRRSSSPEPLDDEEFAGFDAGTVGEPRRPLLDPSASESHRPMAVKARLECAEDLRASSNSSQRAPRSCLFEYASQWFRADWYTAGPKGGGWSKPGATTGFPASSSFSRSSSSASGS